MAKKDVQQGTLAMVLKSLDVLGTPHGYGIAAGRKQLQAETKD